MKTNTVYSDLNMKVDFSHNEELTRTDFTALDYDFNSYFHKTITRLREMSWGAVLYVNGSFVGCRSINIKSGDTILMSHKNILWA